MRSCKKDIRTIENGEKNLFLRRTFNALIAGGKNYKRKRRAISKFPRRNGRKALRRAKAKRLLQKYNNNVQGAFNEWRNEDAAMGSALDKFRWLTREAAKIASEQKPKKRKKEKETCPVCYVEIDNLSSAEYTMCPTCKRPTCNQCLCKRYKTTGYDTDGYVNMTRNRSICPRCNGNIPHLKTLCMPRYQWEAKTKRETAYMYEYDEATGKKKPKYDDTYWKNTLDGKQRLTENLFVEEGDVVQWYPKGTQIPFEATVKVRKRVTKGAVYTKRGKCIPGYVRTGRRIKTGRHKGKYRCKMSHQAKKRGVVWVDQKEKYNIKDMLFFVYKVLDEPPKRVVGGRSRKNTRGGTVILLPFCKGHWSYEPNGSFGRTRLPFNDDFWEDNSFLSALGFNDEMAVLADKSELAILRGREPTGLEGDKNKVKLGDHTFGVFEGGNEYDSGIAFDMLRHNAEAAFKWHHVGKMSYGDYYLEPISNDDDSDDDNDSDSEDDWDDDSPITREDLAPAGLGLDDDEDDFELNPPVYYSDNDEDDGWRREDNPDANSGNDSDVSHASTVIIPGRGGTTIQDIFGESDSDD